MFLIRFRSGLFQKIWSSFSSETIPSLTWTCALGCHQAWRWNISSYSNGSLQVLCQNNLIFGAIYDSLYLDQKKSSSFLVLSMPPPCFTWLYSVPWLKSSFLHQSHLPKKFYISFISSWQYCCLSILEGCPVLGHFTVLTHFPHSPSHCSIVYVMLWKFFCTSLLANLPQCKLFDDKMLQQSDKIKRTLLL